MISVIISPKKTPGHSPGWIFSNRATASEAVLAGRYRLESTTAAVTTGCADYKLVLENANGDTADVGSDRIDALLNEFVNVGVNGVKAGLKLLDARPIIFRRGRH
jgi:hypothetical protein